MNPGTGGGVASSMADWVAEIQKQVGEAPALLKTILGQFKLDLDGIHGVDHWLRVHANGMRLARNTGADVDVIRWFALLHDCRRLSNGSDPDHGPRAAMFAWGHRRDIDLDQHHFDLLLREARCKIADFYKGQNVHPLK